MYCDKCGSKIPDGSLFCTSCGARLGQVRKEETSEVSPNTAREEMAKVNAAALSTVDLANEEALKTAKEFTESVSAEQAMQIGQTEQTGQIVQVEQATVDEQAGQAEQNGNIWQAGMTVKDEQAGSDPEKTAGNEIIPVGNNPLQEPDQNGSDDVKNELILGEEKQGEIQKASGSYISTERNNLSKPSGEIKQGKSIPAGLIIVASLGLVVLIVALVFILSASARNGVKRAFMSDENYFKSVEKNAVLDLIDNIGEAYEDDVVGLFDFMKSEYALSVDVDVKDEAEDFLESIYKKNRDLDLSWIKQANAEAEFSMNSKMLRLNGEANVNKKSMFDFDLIGNLNDNKFFMGIPILSKEYAELDYSDVILDPDTAPEDSTSMLMKIIENENLQKALPTTKEINRITSRYLDIFLNKLERIKFYEDQKLQVGNVKGKYLMITAELSEDLQPAIYDAVLKELSKDDEVLAIINRVEKTGLFGDKVSADAFLDWIEKEQDEVYKRVYPFRTLSIWVDDSGKVVGQQLMTDSGTGFIYKYVINGENFGFEFYNQEYFSVRNDIRAEGTVSGTSVSGNIKYFYKGSEKFSLDFTDVDVIDLLRGKPTGTLVLDLYDMKSESQFRGMKLTAKFSLSLDKSTVKMVLSENGKNIIEADVAIKKSSSGKIKEPSKVLDIGNNNTITSWVKNFDWDTVLKNADKANMPSRYYRQLEKWSESDLDGELREINRFFNSLLQALSINERDLYRKLDWS